MVPTALLSVLALAVSLGGLARSPVPLVPTEDVPPPTVSADSWIVYDLDSDTVLARWNADERRSMASVTKVMTAIVVLEHASRDEIVTVPALATGGRGSVAGLVAGEQWTVGDLLTAMMVRSGNDAAIALAWHVGGGSVDAFVAMMNQKAADLGLADTHFANPNGLDNEGHYSTATDLLALTKASLDFPEIGRVASIRAITMAPDPTGKTREWTNTNALLGAYPGVVGLKTGDTPWADKVLLAVAERGPTTILAVVMHSDDHFADTRELLDWGFRTGGLRDRYLRVFFADQGGGAIPAADLHLTESHERRLSRMLPLDDGRWRMSRLEDLPKSATLGEWLSGALPEAAGGGG
jgi:D-alanyl-D-alanine carboxypeptidase